MFRNQPRQFNERPQTGYPQLSQHNTYAGYTSGSNVAPGQQFPPQQGQQMPPQMQGQQAASQQRQQTPSQMQSQQTASQQRQQTPPQMQGQQTASQQRQQMPPQMQGQQIPPQQRQQMPPQMQGQQMPPQQGQQMPPQMQGQRMPPQQGQQTPPQMQSQQTASQQGQQMPPQMQGQAPSRENSSDDESGFAYSGQIARADGRNKLIDFSDHLVLALPEDYAHIHGIGGAKHSPRSTISVAICDYSGGNGGQSKSFTVRFRLDVRDVDLLYTAAMEACMPGLLHPNDCKYQPGVPYFSYSREKNQGAYKRNPDGTAPVKKIDITFTPLAKDGTPSNYPWYICITNFDAPVKTQRNGSITHSFRDAKNIQKGFINLSRDDFRSCMTSVKRYVELWEQIMASEMIAKGIARRKQILADRAKNS